MSGRCLLGLIAALCDAAAAMVVLVPLARSRTTDLAEIARAQARVEVPTPFPEALVPKAVEGHPVNPFDLQQQHERQWLRKLMRERRRAELSAGLALVGAILAVLAAVA
jgi:hypothetical protein